MEHFALRVMVFASFFLSAISVARAVEEAMTQISSDPYTNPSSQHKTQVEPDTFSFGATIVSAFQVGRFFDGGSSNIGWATSTDAGNSWKRGFLPGITKFEGSGSYDRVSDPSVAYDLAHKVWLISSLPIREGSPINTPAILVSRSIDGGLSWGLPVVVATAGSSSDFDKNWTACDNTLTSPHFGNCYTEWDDSADGDLLYMSTSNDGGVTWEPAKTTADHFSGLGGQPVVQPDGTAIVPFGDALLSRIVAFTSKDGGASWSRTNTIGTLQDHQVAAGLRAPSLPTAEIDGSGKVFVAWQDCRFESNCNANDIVMSTSTDGVTWSSVVRIPLDPVGGGVDHFTPGLAVDKSTSGTSAHLQLTYYFYPKSDCTVSTCQLMVGSATSHDGGATWLRSSTSVGPLNLSLLPKTSQGIMVGDYISSSFALGQGHPVFATTTTTELAMHSLPIGVEEFGPGVPVEDETILSFTSNSEPRRTPVRLF